MKHLFSTVMIAVLAFGLVPTARAMQAPPATAPLSPEEINKLFQESAALGKNEQLVLGEAEALASAEDAFTNVNGAKDNSESAAVDSHNSAMMSQCHLKDWNKPGYQHCPGMITEDKVMQATYLKHHAEFISALNHYEADKDKLREKYKAIEARLKTIHGILEGQKAFTDALDKCEGYSTLEAQTECMKKRWENAPTPERNITIPDPKHSTVVVPVPGRLRTPSEAIEEYLKSGPPKPVLRPSGEKMEPPPPGQ